MQRIAGIAALLGAMLAAAPARADTPPDWRAGLEAFAKAHFRHPAWGWQHNLRDYDVARDLARSDGVTVDDDVLFAAAWMEIVIFCVLLERFPPDVVHFAYPACLK